LIRAIIGWEPYELIVRRGLRKVTMRITVGDFDAISYLFRRFSIRKRTPITTHNPMPDLVDSEFRIRIAVTAAQLVGQCLGLQLESYLGDQG
jgi:hypothetical protein